MQISACRNERELSQRDPVGGWAWWWWRPHGGEPARCHGAAVDQALTSLHRAAVTSTSSPHTDGPRGAWAATWPREVCEALWASHHCVVANAMSTVLQLNNDNDTDHRNLSSRSPASNTAAVKLMTRYQWLARCAALWMSRWSHAACSHQAHQTSATATQLVCTHSDMTTIHLKHNKPHKGHCFFMTTSIQPGLPRCNMILHLITTVTDIKIGSNTL